jgi:membrane dipeptidase
MPNGKNLEDGDTFIFDAHLDLAMNAMEWNRDLRLSVPGIRERESDLHDKPDRALGTVSLPALRKGNIGLVVATQIAGIRKKNSPFPGWFSQQQAWAQTQGQLAWYKTMDESAEMVQIHDVISLESHLRNWQSTGDRSAVGYVLSLEGADSLITLDHLHRSFKQGLRAVGPAHYGPGIYAQGTDSAGGLGVKGRKLLKEMERLKIILDVTHLCDDSFWEALDLFHGPIWSSHSNCRSLVPHHRQLSDPQIKELIARDAVIGIALDAWMLVPDWHKGISTPEQKGVTLDCVCDHIDHICQLNGDTAHVGIGSDLDGVFGKEQCPHDLDTIADLQKIAGLLYGRGYSPDDVHGILSGNFINFLRRAWE